MDVGIWYQVYKICKRTVFRRKSWGIQSHCVHSSHITHPVYTGSRSSMHARLLLLFIYWICIWYQRLYWHFQLHLQEFQGEMGNLLLLSAYLNVILPKIPKIYYCYQYAEQKIGKVNRITAIAKSNWRFYELLRMHCFHTNALRTKSLCAKRNILYQIDLQM